MKKYRVFALLGVLALTSGSLYAQDYDDIYYDASKSVTTETKAKTKVVKPTKTIAVYGEVPETYKVAVRDNYRVERDVDEYNRHSVYEPQYEVDINGDTIYMDSTYVDDDMFANTRRIERFYNPDIVILSDDDELVELYYDESPTINLVVGSDWGYGSYYGLGYASSYYPWYTGWYEPWYYGWYSPWHWHSPWYYGYTNWGFYNWGWTYYSPWYYSYWNSPYWGWGHHHGWYGNYTSWSKPHHSGRPHYSSNNWMANGHRAGMATNRNGRGRVSSYPGSNRNGIAPRGSNGNRPSGVGGTTGRGRGGYATSRGGGNMGSRNSAGVTPRNSGSVSRSSGSRSYSSGNRSSNSSSYGGSRSYGGSSHSSGSYSGGSSHSSGGYSGGGSRGSSGGGGGSHGGSGGSHRH